jgi:hypothetical protein
MILDISNFLTTVLLDYSGVTAHPLGLPQVELHNSQRAFFLSQLLVGSNHAVSYKLEKNLTPAIAKDLWSLGLKLLSDNYRNPLLYG